jgi:hypothetical protein
MLQRRGHGIQLGHVVEGNLRNRIGENLLRAMEQPRARRAVDGPIRFVEQLRQLIVFE